MGWARMRLLLPTPSTLLPRAGAVAADVIPSAALPSRPSWPPPRDVAVTAIA